MTEDLKILKAISEQELDTTLSEALAARIPQYQKVSAEEILDLLEAAVETYALLKEALSPRLRHIARKEIDFFLGVYQDNVTSSRPIHNPQPPQKVVDLLSRCAS